MINKILSISLMAFLLGCSDPPSGNQFDSSDVIIEEASSPIDSSLTHFNDGGFSLDGGLDLQSAFSGNITYHTGPVMIDHINVYFIWYGNWNNSPAVPLLVDLINNFGSSNYNKINSEYYQVANNITQNNKNYSGVFEQFVSDKIVLAKSIDVGYSHGTFLTDADIETIVEENIANKLLPLDFYGAYFILTSKDVKQGLWGLCINFCGWHDFRTINGIGIKYAIVGDTEACPKNCSVKQTYLDHGFVSPNGNWSADGTSSIIIHELSEMMTDPNIINGWHSDGQYSEENMDMCAWTYGQLYYTLDGRSLANVKIGSRDWLIQQNWVLPLQHCGLVP